MIEAIGVIVSLIFKWYKASGKKQHRYIGFVMSIVLSCFWIFFFLNRGLCWLAFYSCVGAGICCRGIWNNRNDGN